MQIQKNAVNLTDLAVGIVVLGVVVSVGATILINVRNTNLNATGGYSGTAAYNVSDKAAQGIAEYGNWFKILVIVGVSSVILGLIFMAFGKSSDAGQAY